MKKSLYFVMVSTMMLAAFGQRTDAQCGGSSPAEKQCGFSETYRPEGWEVPGLSGAVPKSERMSLKISPGGIVEGVFVTEMKAKSISNLLLPRCTQEHLGRLSIESLTVRVVNMWKVDFKGKVFAYVVDYEPQIMEKDGPHGTLCSISLVFLDVDGSGRFKVMRWNQPLRKSFLFSPEIPDWAKQSSG
jgi:hypothetical protein